MTLVPPPAPPRATSAVLPDGVLVNVGSGPRASDGWLSLDGSWQAWFAAHPWLARVAARATGRQVGHWDRGIVRCDVRRGLPLPDGAAAAIYSSHLIEHLHRSDALALLRECRRALAPGGICRIVTPDLAHAIATYLAARDAAGDPQAADRLQESLLLHPSAPERGHPLHRLYLQRTAFHQHKWVFDAASLRALFREAGFEAPRQCDYLESDIPRDRLAQVELADRIRGGAGVCVEARR